MKVSLSWLREYVDIRMEPGELAEALTMAGLEVDTYYDRYARLEAVTTAKIIAVAPHPNADRLKCCDVDTGNGVVRVICGAPNAAVDMVVPLARPGTELPDGRTIGETEIRGVDSHGMLCSEIELELGTDASGLMVLSSDLELGLPLNRALGLNDTVFDIDLTPNRPDCLSVVGIAREVAAIQKTPLKPPEIPAAQPGDAISQQTSVVIDDPDLCPRYAARLIDGVTVGPSPSWLQDRLLSVGQRPINNLVDVTNFVMLELGQPLHAFDFDRLADNRIVVRRAEAGERFTTLDNKERLLDTETLMICDGEKPVAVGGVMGGLNSEIEMDTRRVLLESAYFNPVSIRRTAKKLGLNTEASHRFERGVDPEGTLLAINRAARLIAEVGGGRLVTGVIDAHPEPTSTPPIALSIYETNRILGTDLDEKAISDLLASVGFHVADRRVDGSDVVLTVERPSCRVDVAIAEDLVEEVARLWGYGNIPTRTPLIRSALGDINPMLDLRSRVRRLMTGFGFTEAINYSFISAAACDRLRLTGDDPRRKTVHILNPITEDQAVMRTSLVPGLLDTLARNLSQQVREVKVFEVGKGFWADAADTQPEEREMAAGLWSGSQLEPGWHGKPVSCDFYDIKGALEGLLAGLRADGAVFAPVDEMLGAYLRPGHGAVLNLGGQPVGIVGEVHPEVLESHGVKQSAFVFELDLDRLSAGLDDTITVRPIPRFPGTTRDVTLILDRRIPAADALNHIETAREPLVESVRVFDVFEGEPIPGGQKSLSLRVAYRSPDGTLEDEEINRIHQKLTQGLLDALGAALP